MEAPPQVVERFPDGWLSIKIVPGAEYPEEVFHWDTGRRAEGRLPTGWNRYWVDSRPSRPGFSRTKYSGVITMPGTAYAIVCAAYAQADDLAGEFSL